MRRIAILLGSAALVLSACSGSPGGGVLDTRDGGPGPGDDGGAPPTDGGPGDAGVACTGAATTFELTITPPTRASSFCTGSCGAGFLTILREDGTALPFGDSCKTSCGACQPVACSAAPCAAPRAVKPEGESVVWNGTYYLDRTCGAGLACAQPECAEPGKYIARMCVFHHAGDAGAAPFCQEGAKTCTDVPFVWPAPSAVRGTISA